MIFYSINASFFLLVLDFIMNMLLFIVCVGSMIVASTAISSANVNDTLHCSRALNLMEITQLLKTLPCVLIEIEPRERRQRSATDAAAVSASNIDVKALQATINDHRTMINYLVNNSINATYVTDAVKDHHIETGPIFRSWRDTLLILLCMAVLGNFIYTSMCGSRANVCDSLLGMLFRSNITRIIEKKEGPMATTNAASAKEAVSQKQSTHQSYPLPTIHTVSEAVQYNNNGYIYE